MDPDNLNQLTSGESNAVSLLDRVMNPEGCGPLKQDSLIVIPLKRIKVIVVEAHNEALSHIYRSIGSKKIPFHGLKLLHFDSHPDLCIPSISGTTVKSSPDELLSQIHIENWIMPSIFAGHIDHVVWMHPKWSNQLNNRMSANYVIGNHKKTQKLCVNIPESYFYNEGSFAPVDDMDSPVPFGLTVSTIHEANTLCKVCIDVISVLLNNNFILDVDLDTFSTQDPFRDFYTKEQFTAIDRLFTPPRAPTLRLPVSEANDEAGEEASPEEVIMSANLVAKVTNDARRKQLLRLRLWMTILASGTPIPLKDVTDNLEQLFALTNLLLSMPDDYFTSTTRSACEISRLSAIALLNKDEASTNQEIVNIDESLFEVTSNSNQQPISPTSIDNERCSPSTMSMSVSPYPMQTRSQVRGNDTDNSVVSMDDEDVEKTDREEKRAPVERMQTNDSSSGCDETDDHAMMMHLHDLWSSIADQENDSLPHHVSTELERTQILEEMESLLNRLHNPSLITVSRSVDDGYTPSDQIAGIQMSFFRALERVYGRKLLTIFLDYDAAESDFMALSEAGFDVHVRSSLLPKGSRPQRTEREQYGPTAGGDYRSEPGRKDFS